MTDVQKSVGQIAPPPPIVRDRVNPFTFLGAKDILCSSVIYVIQILAPACYVPAKLKISNI